ncbi:unnamed protein product [Adineta ricciae]|uniref:NAD(P)(+)--arginine ADP-ribosyltransferase n=2 Tax=Adineta ricciae TaxID=249248 RepID=A0A814VDM7_ADIRI|nr:unnamed protein product [Adineta ricciae]
MMTDVQRFFATGDEPMGSRPPILDLKDVPALPLEKAVHTLKEQIKIIRSMATEAKNRTMNLADGLSHDESASIYLYTMEHKQPQNNVFMRLNKALYNNSQASLNAWCTYLKLFMAALDKLPPVRCTVYRAGKGDLTGKYKVDSFWWWWGFNSCVKSKKSIDRIIGSNGIRTVFRIECFNGKDISKHSTSKNNTEILLMPGTRLRVTEITKLTKGVVVIRLSEETNQDGENAPIDTATSSIPETTSSKKVNITTSNQANDLYASSNGDQACQFRTEPRCFDYQYHENGNRSIVKPDELEIYLQHPPSTTQADTIDRISGSLIGMALGDALGAHVEFRPRDFLLEHPVTNLESGGTWGLEKGQFTDDTSMALCLAISLVARHDFVMYDQLVRYKWWFQHGYMSSTGSCFDIGTATKQAILEFEQRQKEFAKSHNIPLNRIDYLSDPYLLSAFDARCSQDGVAGNGALMRLAPVPLFFYKYPECAVELSGLSGLITHGDRKAYDACRYYGALIVAAVRGETKNALTDNNFYYNHEQWFNGVKLCPEIMEIARGSYKREGGYDEGIRGKGYIVSALEAALWAFYYDSNSFKVGALSAVNLGDDTDTTAAIYGQLAGAFYGYHSLPREWVQQVYARKFILCLSDWIIYEGNQWGPKRSMVNQLLPLSRHENDVDIHSLPPKKPTNTAKPKEMFNPNPPAGRLSRKTSFVAKEESMLSTKKSPSQAPQGAKSFSKTRTSPPRAQTRKFDLVLKIISTASFVVIPTKVFSIMKSNYLLCLLVLGLLVCFAVSLPAASNVEAADFRKISLDCTLRCGWWNACMFNGGSCPEPSDCQCRQFG